jgi:hypothetical protein
VTAALSETCADGINAGVTLRSGITVQRGGRVWITEGLDEVEGWGDFACFKASEDLMRASRAASSSTRSSRTASLDAPVERLSPTETTCQRARVLRRVRFVPFDLDWRCAGS